jgi:hypothetical protein
MADNNDNDQFQSEDEGFDVPEQPLAQDYDPPAAPPDENDDETLPSSHPALDSNLDEHEVYDEGPTNASEAYGQHVNDGE